MKLAIISHTDHYLSQEDEIVGWGPTVREINHLTAVFDEIYHVAMIYDSEPPKSALRYEGNIHFVKIPTSGGQTLNDKLKIIGNSGKTISVVQDILKKVDYFQFRAPTGIGVYLIPYLTFFSKKKGWFKYAGNWNQENPPLGYRMQRWMLKKQSKPVTINGIWENQPSHCLTFENPCLSKSDLEEGEKIRETKSFEGKLNFCFVGRVEEEKGVDLILDTFNKIPQEHLDRIGKLVFVGTGARIEDYKAHSENSLLKIDFLGSQSSSAVFDIYKTSHFLLLPSRASEGFPKVIAEALNFGCIPIVSSVSSITQYIENDINGFVLRDTDSKNLSYVIIRILEVSGESLKSMSQNNGALVNKFTFEYYYQRIANEILEVYGE